MFHPRSSYGEFTETAGGLSSVDGLQVLFLFSAPDAKRIADDSRVPGLAPSTAHRLLGMLEARGFTCSDRAMRAYLVGPELVRPGKADSGESTLEAAAAIPAAKLSPRPAKRCTRSRCVERRQLFSNYTALFEELEHIWRPGYATQSGWARASTSSPLLIISGDASRPRLPSPDPNGASRPPHACLVLHAQRVAVRALHCSMSCCRSDAA